MKFFYINMNDYTQALNLLVRGGDVEKLDREVLRCVIPVVLVQ